MCNSQKKKIKLVDMALWLGHKISASPPVPLRTQKDYRSVKDRALYQKSPHSLPRKHLNLGGHVWSPCLFHDPQPHFWQS